MSENKEQEPKKVLSLSGRPKLELKRAPDATSQVRQSFSHGRSKAVTVEVKRKRVADTPLPTVPVEEVPEIEVVARRPEGAPAPRPGPAVRQLTAEEREARVRALRSAVQEEDRRAPEPTAEEQQAEDVAAQAEPIVDTRSPLDPDARREREIEELR